MAKTKRSRPAQSTEELTAKLDSKTFPLSEIEPHPDNPKIHTTAEIQRLAKFIKEVGYSAGAMAIQESRKRLYKGHKVFAALQYLEYTAADFVVKDLTDDETLLLLLGDNRYGEDGTMSAPQLDVIFQKLELSGTEMTLSGFTMTEIKGIMNRNVKEDDPPPVSEDEPVTQTGDLWYLGDHRVLCGDSTKAEDVERVMGGEKAILVSTDPPYLVDYTGNDRPNESGKDWSATYREIEIKDARAFFEHAVEHAVEHAAFYWWHAHKRASLIEEIWGQYDILVHQQIIWVKPAALHGYSFYPWQHEPCYFGWRRGNKPAHDGDKTHAITSVWTCDWEGKSRIIGNEHPTQKPLEIFAIPIRKHTKPGDICYEPFAGSGSQLIAAEQLGRRTYCIEITAAFCDVIIKRYINHIGTSENVYVERDGKRLSWEQAQTLQQVHVC